MSPPSLGLNRERRRVDPPFELELDKEPIGYWRRDFDVGTISRPGASRAYCPPAIATVGSMPSGDTLVMILTKLGCARRLRVRATMERVTGAVLVALGIRLAVERPLT